MVKKQVKLKDEIDNWISNVASTATKKVGLERLRVSTNFYSLTKRESQALIAHNAGAFKLKTAWGKYHEVQACLAPLCGGRDDLDHIKHCPFYKAVWRDDFEEDCKQLAKYFVAVDVERRRKWKGECLF